MHFFLLIHSKFLLEPIIEIHPVATRKAHSEIREKEKWPYSFKVYSKKASETYREENVETVGNTLLLNKYEIYYWAK